MASAPKNITRDIGGVNPNTYTQAGVQNNALSTLITGVGEAALVIDKEVQTNRLDKELEGLRTEYLTSAEPSKRVQDSFAMSDDDAGEVARLSTELAKGKLATEQGSINFDTYRIRGETLLRTAIARRPGLAEHFRRVAANTLGTDVVGASVLYLAGLEDAEKKKGGENGPDTKRMRDQLEKVGIINADWTDTQVLSVYSDPKVREQISGVVQLDATIARGQAMLDQDEQVVAANRQTTYIQAEGWLAERSKPLYEAVVKLENLLFANGAQVKPEEATAAVGNFRMAVNQVMIEARRNFTGRMKDEDLNALLTGYQSMFTMLDDVVSGKQFTDINDTQVKAMMGVLKKGLLGDPNAANMATIASVFGESVMVSLIESDSTIRTGMSDAVIGAMQGQGDPEIISTNAAGTVAAFAVASATQSEAQRVESASLVAAIPQSFLSVPADKYNFGAYGAFIDKLEIHSGTFAKTYPDELKGQLLDGVAAGTAHYIDNIGKNIAGQSRYAGLRGKVELGLQENGDVIRALPGVTLSREDSNWVREFNSRYSVGPDTISVFSKLGGQDAAATAKKIRELRSAPRPATGPRGVNRSNSRPAAEVTLGSGERVSIHQEGYEMYAPVAMAAAEKYGIESQVLTSLITQESKWNPNAKSPTGVEGIAQVTRATAVGMGYTADNYRLPANQIYGAANYLSQMLKRFKGDYVLAVAAYNAGPGALDKFLRTGEREGNLAKGGTLAGSEGSQAETYVAKVMGFDGDLLEYGRGVLGIQPKEDNVVAGAP
jgi:hypothetical protein